MYQHVVTGSYLCIHIGIQHHDFGSKEEFLIWKESEEAHTHTFYTLHDKPYVMTTDDEGITQD